MRNIAVCMGEARLHNVTHYMTLDVAPTRYGGLGMLCPAAHEAWKILFFLTNERAL